MRGQLAERAAGVFEIFAKAAGTDVKGLQALMKEGKVGSDIVLKAGVMMGEWADKQGTLAVALQQSAAKQEQFNNKLKEMSLLILKSGLDQALAAMFSALVPIVEVVGTALSYILKLLKGIYKAFKILTDFVSENGLYSAIMLVGLAVSGLILAFGRLAVVNTIVFLQMIANTIKLNALLWITRLRLLGIIGVFTYLLSQLDGFFVRGEEDNFLMTWYYTVQLIISELDVLFAKLKYNLFMFRQDPFGSIKEALTPQRQEPLTLRKALTMYPHEWYDYLYNTIGTDVSEVMRNGLLPNVPSPAQAVKQSAPTNIENKFFLNLGGMSLQDKQKFMNNQDVDLTPYVRQSSAVQDGAIGVLKH